MSLRKAQNMRSGHKPDRKIFTLYAVTDRAWTNGRSLAADVESALRGGVTLLQLREKSLSPAEIEDEARELLPLCRRYGVPLIINDYPEVAAEVGADGVHVGQSDESPAEIRRRYGDSLIVGTTARSVEEAFAAEAAGADYLGVGAIFPTSTKTDTRPVSRETLREICRAVSIPVVAIGGVDARGLSQLAGTGIAGAAIVSAIFAANDIEGASRELRLIAGSVTGQCGER